MLFPPWKPSDATTCAPQSNVLEYYRDAAARCEGYRPRAVRMRARWCQLCRSAWSSMTNWAVTGAPKLSWGRSAVHVRDDASFDRGRRLTVQNRCYGSGAPGGAGLNESFILERPSHAQSKLVEANDGVSCTTYPLYPDVLHARSNRIKIGIR